MQTSLFGREFDIAESFGADHGYVQQRCVPPACETNVLGGTLGQCTGIIISGLVVCGWMTKWVD